MPSNGSRWRKTPGGRVEEEEEEEGGEGEGGPAVSYLDLATFSRQAMMESNRCGCCGWL
jgi:hypothetical protein